MALAAGPSQNRRKVSGVRAEGLEQRSEVTVGRAFHERGELLLHLQRGPLAAGGEPARVKLARLGDLRREQVELEGPVVRVHLRLDLNDPAGQQRGRKRLHPALLAPGAVPNLSGDGPRGVLKGPLPIRIAVLRLSLLARHQPESPLVILPILHVANRVAHGLSRSRGKFSTDARLAGDKWGGISNVERIANCGIADMVVRDCRNWTCSFAFRDIGLDHLITCSPESPDHLIT